MSAAALRNRLTTVVLVGAVLALSRALWPDDGERAAAQYVFVLTLGYGHLLGAALVGRRDSGLRPHGVSARLWRLFCIVSVGTLFAAYATLLGVLPEANFVVFASPLLAISIWHTVENDSAVVAAYERGFSLGAIPREARGRTLGLVALVALGAILLSGDETLFAEVFAISTLYHLFQWLVFLRDRIAAGGDPARRTAILRGIAWTHVPTALACLALVIWRPILPPVLFDLVFSPSLYLFWSSLHVAHTALARSARSSAGAAVAVAAT